MIVVPKKNSQSGVSLVEVLMVLAAVSILVFLVSSIPNSITLINKSVHLSLVKEISIKKLAELKKKDYASLTDETITDQRLKTLPSGIGNVTVSDCNETICPNGEEIKQVEVNITWKENGKTQSFKIQSLITEGGL